MKYKFIVGKRKGCEPWNPIIKIRDKEDHKPCCAKCLLKLKIDPIKKIS